MKKLSQLQKVCLQYGRDCWKLSNSYQLAEFLKRNGQRELGYAVQQGIHTAKSIARQRYFEARKSLDPEWKDWDEQMKENFGD
jgi:hypothetical protein